MTDKRDEEGNLLTDDIRLTLFGKALRVTSLDEVPEMINILKGDMSLIWIRPQMVRDMVFRMPFYYAFTLFLAIRATNLIYLHSNSSELCTLEIVKHHIYKI